MTRIVSIEGLTPLVFGYGKPFVQGSPGAYDAESLPVPLPQTVVGAFRNEIARQLGWFDFKEEYRERLLAVSLRGPMLADQSGLMYPSPADCANVAINGRAHRASSRPVADGDAVWLPTGVLPTQLGNEEYEPSKSEHLAFWSHKVTVDWLCQPDAKFIQVPAHGLPSVPMDTRMHVSIESARRSHRTGQLFATSGALYGARLLPVRSDSDDSEAKGPWRVLNPDLRGDRSIREVRADELKLTCALEGEQDLLAAGFKALTLGGYRGLALAEESDASFDCPDSVRVALTSAARTKRIRLQLATPGAFDAGWKPSLDCLKASDIDLKIVSCCVGRKVAASGWQGTNGSAARIKPNRWLAPAGSVYFCEVQSGDPNVLADWWLRSVSDGEQDRRDGFGLALWGGWDYVGD